MIKGTIHKEDRCHKLRNKIHKAKIRRTIREKMNIYIIIVRHINISLRMFYQIQKNKNRSILNYVINTL